MPVEAITERDIDMLLLEELNTDSLFCEWFLEELRLPKITENIGTWKSISDFGEGETDLLMSYKSENVSIFVLIENKIDAPFQEKQYERYLKRANQYVENKYCEKAFCILIAPLTYCENQAEFEHYISYENIIKKLYSNNTDRSSFRAKLLEIATEKQRCGYQAINNEIVQSFHMKYWQLKENLYPKLPMKKPLIVPEGNDWIRMKEENFKNITLIHKFSMGCVDATFYKNSAKLLDELKQNFPEESSIVEHNKSFSIRFQTSKIDQKKTFEEQKESVLEALKKLSILYNWLKENSTKIFSKK